MPSSASRSREHCRQEERDAKLAAEAETVLDNVTAQLGMWASDRVGSLSSPQYQFGSGGDAEVLWMKNVLERSDDQDEGDSYGDQDMEMVSPPGGASSSL